MGLQNYFSNLPVNWLVDWHVNMNGILMVKPRGFESRCTSVIFKTVKGEKGTSVSSGL